MPKEVPMVFDNESSDYYYYFFLKDAAEELHFQFKLKTKLQELIKFGKKLQKLNPADYNLLITQYLWQAHYQMLLIIFLKKILKLNVNANTMIKNVKLAELNTKIASVFLDTQTLKIT